MEEEIKFAVTDYQGEPEVAGHIGERVVQKLSTTPFPAYPPRDFTEVPEYGGFKLFGIDGLLCVSHFRYEGATDETNRPVSTCTVALMTEKGYESVGRDVVSVRDYLRGEGWKNPDIEGLRRHQQETETIDEKRFFEEVCWEFDTDFLAASTSLIWSGEGTNIYYEREETAEDLVRVAYSLLPHQTLSEVSLTSECDDTERIDSEDISLLPHTESQDRREDRTEDGNGGGIGSSRLGSFIRGGDDKDQDSVDDVYIPNQRSARGQEYDLIDEILYQLVEGEEWHNIGWKEKRSILIEYLQRKDLGGNPDLFEMSERLNRMKKTVESARRIG